MYVCAAKDSDVREQKLEQIERIQPRMRRRRSRGYSSRNAVYGVTDCLPKTWVCLKAEETTEDISGRRRLLLAVRGKRLLARCMCTVAHTSRTILHTSPGNETEEKAALRAIKHLSALPVAAVVYCVHRARARAFELNLKSGGPILWQSGVKRPSVASSAYRWESPGSRNESSEGPLSVYSRVLRLG